MFAVQALRPRRGGSFYATSGMWTHFFIAAASASAALAGLVIVAISVNLNRILEFSHLPAGSRDHRSADLDSGFEHGSAHAATTVRPWRRDRGVCCCRLVDWRRSPRGKGFTHRCNSSGHASNRYWN